MNPDAPLSSAAFVPAAAAGSADGAVATPHAVLAATPWLRQVPPATLHRLASLAVLHRMPPGSTLFEQSQTPAFAKLLLTGSVALIGISGKAETLIELIRPVDLLLPAAVLNRQPFLAQARVLEEAQLMLIQADAFRDAVAADQALCLAVLACQAAHFRRQVKLGKNLKLRQAEDRVGSYLRALVRNTPPGVPVRLPLEKRMIALHLGMTRETFSRVLAVMERHGLRIAGDIVTVIDAATLAARFPLDPLIDDPEPVIVIGAPYERA